MKMSNIEPWIKDIKTSLSDKKTAAPIVSVFVYLIFLALLGIFGKHSQKGVKKGVKLATMISGLGLAAWLPGRIMDALEKNKVHVEEVKEDNKIVEAANEAKKKKERILKAINKGETL